MSNRKPDTKVKLSVDMDDKVKLSVDMDDYYRIINGKDEKG